MAENNYIVMSTPTLIVGTVATNIIRADDAVAATHPNWLLLAAGVFCEPRATWNGSRWVRRVPTAEELAAVCVFVAIGPGFWVINTTLQRDKIVFARLLVEAGGSPFPFSLDVIDEVTGEVSAAIVTTGGQLATIGMAFWNRIRLQ